MKTNNIRAKDWHNYGRWIQPPLPGAFWAHWHESTSAQRLLSGKPLSPILFLDGYTLLPEKDIFKLADSFLEDYKSKTLGRTYAQLEEMGAQAEERHLKLLSDARVSVNEYVVELFDSYLEMVGVWTFCFTASPIEKLVKEEGLAETDEDILQKVKPFIRITWLEQQNRDIKKLARGIGEKYPHIVPKEITSGFFHSDPDLQKRLSETALAYAWFGTHHWNGDAYTEEHCIDDIKRALAQVAEKEEVLPEKFSAREDVWKLIASLMYWRTHCAEVTTKVIFHSRGKLAELAGQWGLTYEYLTYLTAEEIKKSISQGALDLPLHYKERRNGYGVLIEEGGERVIVGEELQKWITAVVPKVDSTISEIKGAVGSKGGVVRGRAKVILSPSEFGKFENGDILIANDTTPDFVPLMKKALAIVTDTGGITSHAAIVSRELRKPCVIGTKIATQVFKDGDMVEVDAERGIVAILRRRPEQS